MPPAERTPSPPPPPKACRVANDEMAKVVARYPDRFIGVALIPTITEQVRPVGRCSNSGVIVSIPSGFDIERRDEV